MIEAPAPAGAVDAHVWRDLQARLRPFVARRVATRADVDDVVQEVFLRIQRGLPALRDGERFGPWVYQVTRSAIAEHRRTQARHPVTASSTIPERRDEPEETSQSEVEQEVAAYTALFVGMLPSPYREALTLTELEGLSQTEAAAMLGLSVSGMKTRVQRGRRKLRAALQDCCDIALDARRRVIGCEPREGAKLPAGCCE